MQAEGIVAGAERRVASEEQAASSPEQLQPNHKEMERRELERVLQHPAICRSTNLVRFLSYICNKYFEDKTDEIREYSIAVEALGRKAESFDSHVDPIVRVTALALRKKLREVYAESGLEQGLQIVLPLGHYVPEFVRRTEAGSAIPEAIEEAGLEEAPEEDAPPRRTIASWRLLFEKRKKTAQAVAAALILAGIFSAGYFIGRHSEPRQEAVHTSFQWGEPVWSDEFDGAARQSPDPAKWGYETGNQNGWGNHEMEVYCAPAGGGAPGCDPRHPSAFLDGAGHLVLRAERNAGGLWTSSRLTTRGLKSFQYGRVEARIKMPVGTGLWPSFWMLGDSFSTVGWPAAGSVDIVENVGMTPDSNGVGPNRIRSTVHGPRYFGGNGLWHDYKLPDGARVDDGNFHLYGIIWSPGMIQFYVDDPANVYFIQDSSNLPEGGEWVFDHPFNLIINLAVGGEWPGSPDASTPSPADLIVDYVRVYNIPTVQPPSIQWQPVEVKAGADAASIVSLRAPSYAGRVHLTCSTEPATATCALATSVVNFSDTLVQQDTLTLSTDSFTDKGRMVAPPGHYKVTVTATTISGNQAQLTAPFEVVSSN